MWGAQSGSCDSGEVQRWPALLTFTSNSFSSFSARIILSGHNGVQELVQAGFSRYLRKFVLCGPEAGQSKTKKLFADEITKACRSTMKGRQQ